jgi:HlyD family secretion protein
VLRDSEGFIAAGTPMFELGDLRALEIVIDVLSSDAARIAPGMPVRIAVDGEAARVGRVRVVEQSAFARVSALGVEEQRVNVIATIDGDAGAPGTTSPEPGALAIVHPSDRVGDGTAVEPR